MCAAVLWGSTSILSTTQVKSAVCCVGEGRPWKDSVPCRTYTWHYQEPGEDLKPLQTPIRNPSQPFGGCALASAFPLCTHHTRIHLWISSPVCHTTQTLITARKRQCWKLRHPNDYSKPCCLYPYCSMAVLLFLKFICVHCTYMHTPSLNPDTECFHQQSLST